MVGSLLTKSDFSTTPLPASNLRELGVDRVGDARVLLIEDSSFARKTITAILSNYGFDNLRCAADGAEGVRMAIEWSPEVIITDLFMPVKSGFDVCKDLRRLPEFHETPIIVQTSSDTPALRGDVFEAGASDLITKPINARELLSRLIVHLERIRLIDSLKAYRNQMREELDAAKAMQMELLPADNLIAQLERTYPARFAWHSQPCQGLAGDIWDVRALDENSIRLWAADFTGHGVRSALNTFRLNTFVRTREVNPNQSPEDWLASLNVFLCDVLPLGQFATLLCCDIDFAAGKVKFASAGAPEPVLRRAGRHELIDISGMPIGISKRAEFGVTVRDMGPGDSIFAYSDALTETPSADDPLFTPENLVCSLDALTCDLASKPARLLSRLMEVSEKGLDDDLTLVFVEWQEGAREEV
ncbi:PP2C family protein-serine/threonine phosphatase [Roseibium sp.]|uniref:PP2C family protein-serine/threonine phosphatase n=1 Tax=Roseibium sp. TaxID=1936156 RepID=UPI003A982768